MTRVVGVDVGGTRIKAVLVDTDGSVLDRVVRPTPRADHDGRATTDVVRDAVATLGRAPVGVGLVVPGIVDEVTGTAVASTNLGWRDVPIRRLVEEATGIPTAFGHDVRAGALAEKTWGAARVHDGLVAFVPIGTGISAAFAGGGTHLEGHPLAGEFGTVRAFSRADGSGPHTLEDVAGGPAIAQAAGLDSVEAVVRAVAAGDVGATRAWEAAVNALAQGLAWLTAIVSPGAIVIGGGVALAGEALFVPLRERLPALLTVHDAPPLLPAELGEWAGARGAALIGGRS